MQLVTTSNSQLQVGICEFHPPRIQTKRALAYCIVWLDLLLCWWNQDSHRARGHLQHTHLQKSPEFLGLSKQGSILKDKLPEAWRKHFCSFLRHFDQDKINPWLCEFPHYLGALVANAFHSFLYHEGLCECLLEWLTPSSLLWCLVSFSHC